MQKQKIRMYDIENLPFGIHITVKTFNGELEKAVAIVGNIAFHDGYVIPFENVGNMEIYLGWE